MKKFFSVLLMSFFILGLTVVPGFAQKVLKIGSLGAMTGPASLWGLAMTNCAQMWADEVNAQGGLLVKGEKYKVEIIAEDDKYDAARAVSGAEKLVNRDKVKFIIGTNGTHTTLAALTITNPAKVMLFTFCFDKGAIGPKYPYTFRSIPTAYEFYTPMYQWLCQKFPDKKRLVLVVKNYAGGLVTRDIAIAAIKKRGFYQIVGTEYYQPATTDFYPVMTKILAHKPEILDFDACSGGDAGLLLKAARQLGYKGITVQPTQGDPVTIIETAGKENAEGHYFMGGGSDEAVATPEMVAFIKEYAKRYGSWNEVASQDWYIPRMLGLAIQKAGTINDTDAIAKAMETITMKSPLVKGTPIVKFAGKNYYGRNSQIIMPMCVVQVIQGQPKTVLVLSATHLE
jgi:branched-chain amino acid transport system substrate-binding protein